jgi:hypothetical protein
MNSLGRRQSADPRWGDCIEDVLRQAHKAGEPYLDEQEITRRILDSGRKQNHGKTPERSVNWALNNDSRDRFRRVSRGRYALAIHQAESLDTQGDKRAEDSDADRERWNRYLNDVRRYVESERLDNEEVGYKLEIGDALSEARQAVLAGRGDWPDLVKTATKDNPMAWRQAATLRQWVDDAPDAVLQALRALWTEDDRSTSERIRSFSTLYPWESKGEIPPDGVRHSQYGTSGRGTRLRTISVLLMALDPSRYPPYMRSVFDSAYRRLGIEVPSGEAAEEAQYVHALGFLDELIRRTTEHGLERPSTRLEAQSVVWALKNEDRRPDPPPIRESRPYWFVVAYWDAGDQTDRFVQEGIWQNGYKDKYLDLVKEIEPGDRIAIKAAFVKKHELPFDNRTEDVSTMAIKATGVVTQNMGDGRNLRVDWMSAEPSREWYFYAYQPTVWKVTRDSGTLPWAAKALIDFAFDGAKQDYDRFLRHWYPAWYCDAGTPLAEADLSQVAEELLYDEAELRTIARLLDDKRQVIFQGPPGTGRPTRRRSWPAIWPSRTNGSPSSSSTRPTPTRTSSKGTAQHSTVTGRGSGSGAGRCSEPPTPPGRSRRLPTSLSSTRSTGATSPKCWANSTSCWSTGTTRSGSSTPPRMMSHSVCQRTSTSSAR